MFVVSLSRRLLSNSLPFTFECSTPPFLEHSGVCIVVLIQYIPWLLIIRWVPIRKSAISSHIGAYIYGLLILKTCDFLLRYWLCFLECSSLPTVHGRSLSIGRKFAGFSDLMRNEIINKSRF